MVGIGRAAHNNILIKDATALENNAAAVHADAAHFQSCPDGVAGEQLEMCIRDSDMSLVMGICEGIAVLNFGRIIAKGTPDEIRNNPQVIEAYLGKKEG